MRLKRSKTSIGDLAGIDEDLRSASQSPAQEVVLAPRPPRATRGFSFAELTKRIGTQKQTPRKPVDKSCISRPIADVRFPIVVSSPATVLGEVSPPPSILHSSASSPPRSKPSSVASSREVSRRQSISKGEGEAGLQSPSPLQIATGLVLVIAKELVDSPLQHIPESPLEGQADKGLNSGGFLREGTREEKDKMDPTRLSVQPPVVGTKGRAIQQAKEMQDIVAERARRSGDDPPPYDFQELIGKGAYGRVFKG